MAISNTSAAAKVAGISSLLTTALISVLARRYQRSKIIGANAGASTIILWTDISVARFVKQLRFSKFEKEEEGK
jgi:hypothetical protein